MERSLQCSGRQGGLDQNKRFKQRLIPARRPRASRERPAMSVTVVPLPGILTRSDSSLRCLCRAERTLEQSFTV